MKQVCSIALLLFLVIGSAKCETYPNRVQWGENTFVIWTLKPDAPVQEAVVSISDWYVYRYGNSGKPSVRYIVNTVAAAGMRNVWWRTFGGGQATGYRSQVDGVTLWMPPGASPAERVFDPLAEAVNYSHKLGVNIYAWFPFLEEWHGVSDNVRSRYTDEHRDLWDKKINGEAAGEPSFFFEEYRNYKLDLVREMVERYEVDGLVLDLERTAHRANDWGYFPEMLAAFTSETGLDARSLATDDSVWMAFRAKYVGLFIADVKMMLGTLDRPIELVVWVPWDNLLTAHHDVNKWSQDNIIDRVSVCKYGPEGWGSPGAPDADLYDRLSQSLQKPVSYGAYTVKTHRTNIVSCVNEGVSQGFDGITWFESTPMHWRKLYNEPRKIALNNAIMLKSPEIDMTGGGELFILASGDSLIYIDDLNNPIATSRGDVATKIILPSVPGNHRLIVSCTLSNEYTQKAGIAVEGFAIGTNGTKRDIVSDSNWVSIGSSGQVIRIGQPGVPPFLTK